MGKRRWALCALLLLLCLLPGRMAARPAAGTAATGSATSGAETAAEPAPHPAFFPSALPSGRALSLSPGAGGRGKGSLAGGVPGPPGRPGGGAVPPVGGGRKRVSGRRERALRPPGTDKTPETFPSGRAIFAEMGIAFPEASVVR